MFLGRSNDGNDPLIFDERTGGAYVLIIALNMIRASR